MKKVCDKGTGLSQVRIRTRFMGDLHTLIGGHALRGNGTPSCGKASVLMPALDGTSSSGKTTVLRFSGFPVRAMQLPDSIMTVFLTNSKGASVKF